MRLTPDAPFVDASSQLKVAAPTEEVIVGVPDPIAAAPVKEPKSEKVLLVPAVMV